MARELEKQDSKAGRALDDVAIELEEGKEPFVLVFGEGGSCSAYDVTPRVGAEILLMLERA